MSQKSVRTHVRRRVVRFVKRSGFLVAAAAGIAGFFALLSAQRASAAPAAGPTLEPAVSTAARSLDDLEDGAITARVKSRLALDETIRARDIHVATKDAVVTLTGQIASEAERDRAVKIARETEGVKSVTDRLEVRK